MTSPLERAEQAVEAAELALDRAVDDGSALRPLVQGLIAAVRQHDAETVRAMDPIETALAGQHALNDIARALDPDKETRP